MASVGTYVSGAGHVGLIGWLILGWGFSAEPLPFEVTEFTTVTGEDYARLVAATTPQPGTAEPEAPPVPEVEDTPTPVAPEPEVAPRPAQPEAVEPPAPEEPLQAPDR